MSALHHCKFIFYCRKDLPFFDESLHLRPGIISLLGKPDRLRWAEVGAGLAADNTIFGMDNNRLFPVPIVIIHPLPASAETETAPNTLLLINNRVPVYLVAGNPMP